MKQLIAALVTLAVAILLVLLPVLVVPVTVTVSILGSLVAICAMTQSKYYRWNGLMKSLYDASKLPSIIVATTLVLWAQRFIMLYAIFISAAGLIGPVTVVSYFTASLLLSLATARQSYARDGMLRLTSHYTHWKAVNRK